MFSDLNDTAAVDDDVCLHSRQAEPMTSHSRLTEVITSHLCQAAVMTSNLCQAHAMTSHLYQEEEMTSHIHVLIDCVYNHESVFASISVISSWSRVTDGRTSGGASLIARALHAVRR